MMHPSFICGDDSFKNRRGAKLVKDATKKLFFDRIKSTSETLEPVR
jgi:hypothetical protein